jgi:hypothetical protein
VKRIFKVFFFFPLCLMLLASAAYGETGAELPRIVEDVVRNRDFFGSPWALWGYHDCILLDVERLGEKRVGVDFITSYGLEYVSVYDVETLKVIHAYAQVTEKSRREAMMRTGISVADAMKVAKSALDAEARLKEHDLPIEAPEKTPENKGTKRGKPAKNKTLKAPK